MLCFEQDSERGYTIALYLYLNGEAGQRLVLAVRQNLKPEFIREFSTHVGLCFIPDGTGNLTTTFGPEDVFHYLYAVLHSPSTVTATPTS